MQRYHRCHLHKSDNKRNKGRMLINSMIQSFFLKGEEYPQMDGDIYENWMDTTESPQHL